jgi:hypothetical protein
MKHPESHQRELDPDEGLAEERKGVVHRDASRKRRIT